MWEAMFKVAQLVFDIAVLVFMLATMRNTTFVLRQIKELWEILRFLIDRVNSGVR